MQKNKIKVLHVTYDMRIGGTEQVIKNLIGDNSAAEYDQSIYCLESPIGPWGEELKSKGIKVSTGCRQPGFDLKLLSSLRAHIKQHKIELVHCHQYTPYVYGLLASIGTRAKVIFTEHGRFYPDSSSWKRTLLNPVFEKLTSRITSISSATKTALVDYENFSEDRISVVYNGIRDLIREELPEPVEAFKEKWNLKPNNLVLGTIARLDPIKNQAMMIQAFSKVLKDIPDVRLMIVGDGELREDLVSLCESLKIHDKVIFTGYIANPIVAIHAIDVFLLPSLSEGTSMTLLEAMCLSTPCVVTNAGGNPEIIENNVNGFVTENENLDEYVKAILKLVSSPEMQESMSKAARERYCNLFTDEKMKEHYHAIYQDITQNA